MMLREEIIKLSRLHGLKPWQEEKRYMFSMILNTIYNESIIFKGGTYLWLFHGLRRFSEDLDFTLYHRVEKDLPYIISENLELLGIKNDVKILKNNEITFSFRILSEGPLNTGYRDRVPVYIEISERESIIKNPLQIKFDFPEYNLPVRLLYGMDLNEVLSEKIRAIYIRKKPKDVYDLYYLLSKKDVYCDLYMVNKKLEYYNIKFDLNTFENKLNSQKGTFNKELKNLVLDNLPEINTIIPEIILWINNNIDKK